MNDPQASDTQPVTLVDLMDRLVEVPEPAAVPMWPQTWGWAVVGLAVVVVLGLVLAFAVRCYRANAYRRAALAELDSVGDDAAAVAEILRRTALSAFPRHQVCEATGRAWLEFLEATGNGVAFCNGPGASLALAPYRPSGPTPGVADLARKWVRRHRRSDKL